MLRENGFDKQVHWQRFLHLRCRSSGTENLQRDWPWSSQSRQKWHQSQLCSWNFDSVFCCCGARLMMVLQSRRCGICGRGDLSSSRSSEAWLAYRSKSTERCHRKSCRYCQNWNKRDLPYSPHSWEDDRSVLLLKHILNETCLIK